MRATWKEKLARLTDPSPIVNQLTFLLPVSIVIGMVLTLPSLAVQNWAWFAAAIVGIVLATAFAAVISRSKEWWRFDTAVPAILTVAVMCLNISIGATHSPVEFLVVLLVLAFAYHEGRRYVPIAAAAAAIALVIPILLSPGLAQRADDIWIASFATLALTMFAFAVNNWVALLQENTESRDELLDESVRQIQLLEKSEVERGNAERMLRGVWAAVTEQAVVGTDLTGLIDAWNPGATKMLGPDWIDIEDKRFVTEFHVAEELRERARDLEIVSEPHAVDPEFAALINSARLGIPEIRDWTYVRTDGSELPVQLSVTARTDENGAIVGYLFVASDVTAARDAARLKDEFVGLISHELRTPLSSILGYLELMRDDDVSPLSEDQLQYLGVAERNAHRLLRLVGDLLFTAQVESGVFNLNTQVIDLMPIVAASIESVQPVATAADISVVGDITEELHVDGDPVRIGQAIDNLISNAIKFTPKDGTVTVALTRDKTFAKITVSDNGIGIPASELDQLFSRFFRATTATKNAIPGVGLGLTITKAIVIAHNGDLSVESEEGVGTSFTIRLPLARIRPAAASPKSQSLAVVGGGAR